MESMKIIVTFKQSEKWLYDEILKHSSKSNYIKDVLKEKLEKK